MTLMSGVCGACGNSTASATGSAGSGGSTVGGDGQAGSAGTSGAGPGAGGAVAAPDGGDDAAGVTDGAAGGSAAGSGGRSGIFDANADARFEAATEGGVDDARGDDVNCDGKPSSACSCGGFRMPNPASTGLPNPPSYTANADGTVADNVTGLLWEGTVDPGSYTQAQAIQHCVAKGGAWRLPAALELVSLVDYTIPVPGPTIDPNYFPNTPPDLFWTSSLFTSSPKVNVVSPVPRAWSVNFIAGATLSDEVTNARRVRCVNEPAPRCYSPPYQALAGGLVYDRATGLTWQQTIDASTHTWGSALAYCTSLGSGWRAPSLTELQTIEDYTILGQGLDGIDLPPVTFWSSTPYAANPTEAGTVDWEGQTGYYVVAMYSFRVRCVR